MLSKEEKEMIIVALNMRLNYIQTGSVNLSPHDVSKIGHDAARCEYGAEIKPLTTEQMRLCVKTEDLTNKIMREF